MSRRNTLLLCFDAFGTLFKPRAPIHRQYDEIAKSLGMRGFDAEDIQRTFKTAFKQESKRNPNYGKANGLNAELWWTNVIQNTFRPLTVPDSELPRELVPRLLNRFRSGDGYTLFPDVEVLLNKFRAYAKKNNASLVVGVITNSDDRVPDILTSLGMRVGSLRFGTGPTTTGGSEINDVDFAVMSYDVGHEKPNKRIFEAAQGLVSEVLKCRDGDTGHKFDRPMWPALYIGDDYGCDVIGARNAGWKAILVDREVAAGRDQIERLNDQPSNDLFEILAKTDAVTCNSLAHLAQWVPE